MQNLTLSNLDIGGDGKFLDYRNYEYMANLKIYFLYRLDFLHLENDWCNIFVSVVL